LVESRRALDDRVEAPLASDVEVEVERGLGGRLLPRTAPLGGSGKAPMLVVFRIVFPGVGIPDDSGEGEVGVVVEAKLAV
jgi:hypothetical protein